MTNDKQSGIGIFHHTKLRAPISNPTYIIICTVPVPEVVMSAGGVCQGKNGKGRSFRFLNHSAYSYAQRQGRLAHALTLFYTTVC